MPIERTTPEIETTTTQTVSHSIGGINILIFDEKPHATVTFISYDENGKVLSGKDKIIKVFLNTEDRAVGDPEIDPTILASVTAECYRLLELIKGVTGTIS